MNALQRRMRRKLQHSSKHSQLPCQLRRVVWEWVDWEWEWSGHQEQEQE
jgi:hypothetical protein